MADTFDPRASLFIVHCPLSDSHMSFLKPINHIKICIAAVGVMLLSACASVSIEPEQEIKDAALLDPPSIVYIYLFDTTTGTWEGAVAGETARERIAKSLGENLESRIGEVVPAKLIDASPPIPADGWLVTGKFVRVNPGGKWTRMWIGLGAGGSKFETEVTVYDLTRSATEPIMIFDTTGGSNTEGGTATFNDATIDDVDRTAREIRDYMEKQYEKLSGQAD
jgi:hypothetical protein